MAVVIDGTTGISPVTASGTSASVDGMTVGRGGGEVSTNTAVGASALNSNTTGSNQTAVGYQAGYTNTTGGNFSAFGGQAGYTYNSTTENWGSAFVGFRAGQLTTSGNDNAFVGGFAGKNNTTGSYNVSLGSASLYSNTTASNNTAVGYQAGQLSTTANNAYFGYIAGYTNVSGVGNTYVGSQAGANATGGSNTFVGFASGSSISSGTKNTIIGGYNGNQGGLDIRTLSNHIVLSDGDGNPRLIFNNASPPDALIGCTSNSGVQTATAGGFVCDGSNHLWVTRSGGGGSTMNVGRTSSAGTGALIEWWYNGSNNGTVSTNGSNTTYGTSSDYRLKENIAPMTEALATVAQLKPCTYKWKVDGSDGQGFIAHELQEVVPDCVTGEKDAVETYLDDEGNEQTRIKPQGIDTSFLVATLTAAIQELKAIVDAQAAEIAELKTKVA